jgi:hypothetical protein
MTDSFDLQRVVHVQDESRRRWRPRRCIQAEAVVRAARETLVETDA